MPPPRPSPWRYEFSEAVPGPQQGPDTKAMKTQEGRGSRETLSSSPLPLTCLGPLDGLGGWRC